MQPGLELLLYTDGRLDKPYHGKVGFTSPLPPGHAETVETPDPVYRAGVSPAHHRDRCADDALRGGMPVTVKK